MTETSMETALAGFLADRREHVSQRSFRKTERVIMLMRMSIAKDAVPASDIPVSEITDWISHMVTEVLPHEDFAAPGELADARAVLSALLRWLGSQDHLDAATVKAETARLREQVDERTEVKRCVDALRSCVRPVSPDVLRALPDGDWFTDRTMNVDEVAEDTIIFTDDFDHWASIGDDDIPEPPGVPVTVPAAVAAVTEPGWTIMLSAARIDGEWCLLDVISGEP